jgi:hypothetical protein
MYYLTLHCFPIITNITVGNINWLFADMFRNSDTSQKFIKNFISFLFKKKNKEEISEIRKNNKEKIAVASNNFFLLTLINMIL